MNWWPIIAAVAAVLTFLIVVSKELCSLRRRRKIKKILTQVFEIKVIAEDFKSKNLGLIDLNTFPNEVEILYKSLLTEISAISDSKARQYVIHGDFENHFGKILSDNDKDRKYKSVFGICMRTLEVANEIIIKYS